MVHNVIKSQNHHFRLNRNITFRSSFDHSVLENILFYSLQYLITPRCIFNQHSNLSRRVLYFPHKHTIYEQLSVKHTIFPHTRLSGCSQGYHYAMNELAFAFNCNENNTNKHFMLYINLIIYLYRCIDCDGTTD